MDAAQIWAVIGVLAAAFFGMMTLVSTLFLRVLRAEIGSLRSEMNGRFDTVGARFDTVDAKIAHLDRDVNSLMRREFGIDRE